MTNFGDNATERQREIDAVFAIADRRAEQFIDHVRNDVIPYWQALIAQRDNVGVGLETTDNSADISSNCCNENAQSKKTLVKVIYPERSTK